MLGKSWAIQAGTGKIIMSTPRNRRRASLDFKPVTIVKNFFMISVHLPAKEQTDLYPHTFTAQHTGKSGPVQASIAPHVHTIDKLFQETMINKGLKRIDDPHGGDVRLSNSTVQCRYGC